MFADLSAATISNSYIDRAGSNFSHKGFVVAVRDTAESYEFPWVNESEGWGVIHYTRSGYRHEKKPGWTLIGHPQGCGIAWYDVQASTAKAKREGWGLADAGMDSLTAALCRKPTRKEVVAEAVRLDKARINSYLRSDITTLEVEVALLSLDGKELTPFTVSAGDMPSDDIYMDAIIEAADELVDSIAESVNADGWVMSGNSAWRVLDITAAAAA